MAPFPPQAPMLLLYHIMVEMSCKKRAREGSPRGTMAEIRAVSPVLRYRMGPPPGGWNEQYWITTLEPCYNRHSATVRLEFQRAVWNGTIPVENAEALHYHEVWKRVAKELGLDYRVEYG